MKHLGSAGKRLGLVVASGVLALGLAGCGGTPAGEPGRSAVEVAAAMGVEGQALAALGLDPTPDASASTSPDARPDWKDRRERRKARVLLRKNVLHGEVVVQTKDGTKTVAVQRGEVTAISDASITVKSTDGYSATWKFAADLHVVRHSASVKPEEIKAGAKVGIAGARDGEDLVARLIVVPRP